MNESQLSEYLTTYDSLPIAQSKFHLKRIHLDALSSGEALVNELIIDSVSIDFILDHVIARKTGNMTKELRNELAKLILIFDNWTLDATERKTSDLPRSETGFHSDPYEAGMLRALYSPQRSTPILNGWFDYSDHSKRGTKFPVRVFGQNASDYNLIHPLPGILILFDAATGNHAEPLLSQSDLDNFGGERILIAMTFSFDKMIQLAMKNLGLGQVSF